MLQYQIKPLIDECVRYMLANIQVNNAAKLLYYADLYKLPELKAKVINFICQNANQVMQSSGWKHFIKTKPELMESVLQKITGL